MSSYVQKKQLAGEVSLIPCTDTSEWLVSFKDSLQGYTQIGVEDARYLSIIIVYAKEGKKEPIFFSSAHTWRPSTYEGAHSSIVLPTTAAVATTSTQLWPINHRPFHLL